MMAPVKLGFIGVGKMGTALLQGVLKSGICQPEDIAVHDAWQPSVDACVEANGVHAPGSNAGVVQASDVVLLCVKPQDMATTMGGLPENPSRLFISIAAGVTLKTLETLAGTSHRMVRVMPNTPALVGKSASAYALGTQASHEDGETVEKILLSVGIAMEVKEAQMDAVTGLSGSGPAYVYTIIEALADGGVLKGLPRPVALQLAAQTVAGAAELVLESGEHPATLRDNVTSPGGTTIAGLSELENGGIRAALIQAVSRATDRSSELGKGTD